METSQNLMGHPYLPHLLSDIAGAHRQETPETDEFGVDLEDYLEEMERYISGEDPDHTFGYYCGLGPDDFPPAEIFSEVELEIICTAFREMLASWNASIDLPEKMPIYLRYRFMVNTLSEGFIVLNSGSVSFDYCTGYAPDCALKEYCSCLGYWNEFPEEDASDDIEE